MENKKTLSQELELIEALKKLVNSKEEYELLESELILLKGGTRKW